MTPAMQRRVWLLLVFFFENRVLHVPPMVVPSLPANPEMRIPPWCREGGVDDFPGEASVFLFGKQIVRLILWDLRLKSSLVARKMYMDLLFIDFEPPMLIEVSLTCLFFKHSFHEGGKQ
ncbi:hypothetical protein ACUUL3_02215 [Thiovibrio sp. JS02]